VRVLYNGNYIGGSYTDINGHYSFNAPAGVTLTLEVQPIGVNVYTSCPASGNYVITSLPANNKDFGISCGGTGFDLGGYLYAWGVRPGNTAYVWPDWWNKSCTQTSGTVTVTLPTGVTYVSGNPVPTNVNGQVLTYTMNPYDYYWTYNWNYNNYIEVLGAPNLVIGDTLCFQMTLDPVAGDLNPADNVFETCVPVRNSCDPNEKFEEHAKWSTANIAPNAQLDYTIGFQNVGNDVAYKVVVVDTLDSDADINTLEITGSSHPMNIYMQGTNILKFEFTNINLPSANVNQEQSHGFVTYKIKPKTGLPNGTMLDNRANIFFDFNSAILTNKVTDVIDIALGVNEIISPLAITTYPNPATEYIRINMGNESEAIVQLTDLSGRIAIMQKVKNNGMIKVGNLSSGLYNLQIISGDKNYTGKVIVK
jgi:uncharacterized repeat protein (TIGR01451 family)